jgi:Spy/CpxP family protein refolding chaperone
MQKLFSDPRADEAKLLAKQKELSAFRQRLMDTMDQKLIEGRKLLTPDQIQKLDRMAPPPEIGH